jgi:hypothetical protein
VRVRTRVFGCNRRKKYSRCNQSSVTGTIGIKGMSGEATVRIRAALASISAPAVLRRRSVTATNKAHSSLDAMASNICLVI